MNLTKNFASRRQSWRDSRQDRAEIFATVNLLLSGNLGEIRGSIFPARFWPPGLLLPGENLGEIRGRIVPRFWPLRCFPLGENFGKIRGRIPTRFWPSGISFPGEIPAGKKNPGGQNLTGIPISAGSRQDPGTYFTRVELFKFHDLFKFSRTLGSAVNFKNSKTFLALEYFLALNSSTYTNSGAQQNVCHVHCLITPLYLYCPLYPGS